MKVMEASVGPQKYGFVYIWFDTIRRMFYVGSHEGRPGDGYKTSSRRCRRAIKVRPETFKFRVLKRMSFNHRQELLNEETRWLQMIKPAELGVKYYNLKRVAAGGNTVEGMSTEQKEIWQKNVSLGSKEVWSRPGHREKMAQFPAFGGNLHNREYMRTNKYSIAMSEATLDEKNGFYGKTHSESTKLKWSTDRTGIVRNAKNYVLTNPDGEQIYIYNLAEYLRLLNVVSHIKLGKFLKSGEPISSWRIPDYPLTGWAIKYA